MIQAEFEIEKSMTCQNIMYLNRVNSLQIYPDQDILGDRIEQNLQEIETPNQINSELQTNIDQFLWFSEPQLCQISLDLTQINQEKSDEKITSLEEKEDKENISEYSEKSVEQSRDYHKNIAGYVSKRIIDYMLSPLYLNRLKKMCNRFGCDTNRFKKFYEQKRDKIFGPNSLISLFKCEEQQESIGKVFSILFQKLLKKKYLVFALAQGKMKNLQAYIQYKNKYLLYFTSLFD